MTTQILREHISLEKGALHKLPLFDDEKIVHVASREPGTIDLWFVRDGSIIRPAVVPSRTFLVVGTGEHFTGATHLASAIDGPYVWHLLEPTR